MLRCDRAGKRERERVSKSTSAVMEHKEMLLNIFKTFIRNVIKFVAYTHIAAELLLYLYFSVYCVRKYTYSRAFVYVSVYLKYL